MPKTAHRQTDRKPMSGTRPLFNSNIISTQTAIFTPSALSYLPFQKHYVPETRDQRKDLSCWKPVVVSWANLHAHID